MGREMRREVERERERWGESERDGERARERERAREKERFIFAIHACDTNLLGVEIHPTRLP